MFWISGHNSGTKRATGATGDPLVSKQPEFFMAFLLPAWVTRPERPKGAKDEVKEVSLTELDFKGDFFLGHLVLVYWIGFLVLWTIGNL